MPPAEQGRGASRGPPLLPYSTPAFRRKFVLFGEEYPYNECPLLGLKTVLAAVLVLGCFAVSYWRILAMLDISPPRTDGDGPDWVILTVATGTTGAAQYTGY